jgi:LuxR family maltose regulon positive regulatory protein
LDEKKYASRFITYDIASGWYYYILRYPKMIPDWLKGDFSPYAHAFFTENFGNQLKARYHYMTKNFPPLMSYISDMKMRESPLYGRIEMLAIESCVCYQSGDKPGAFTVLREAYADAAPNGIVMPFIELGKDMRTLTSAVMRDVDSAIPEQWAKTINQKAAIYAKHQALVISEYRAEHEEDSLVALSNRETKVLRDLYNGLSRTEIAINQELSINTVKMIINSIFEKLCANNIVDAIRITAERKLV